MCTVGVPLDAVLNTTDSVEGWREFSVHRQEVNDDASELYLRGMYGKPWQTASLEAVCDSRYFRNSDDPKHEAPQADCNCGIYVVFDTPMQYELIVNGSSRVWAKVRATNYLEGDRGVRARNVEIVELIAPGMTDDRRAELAAKYNVPVGGKEHPLVAEAIAEQKRIDDEREALRIAAAEARLAYEATLQRGELPDKIGKPSPSLYRDIVRVGGFNAALAYARSGKGTIYGLNWANKVAGNPTKRYMTSSKDHQPEGYDHDLEPLAYREICHETVLVAVSDTQVNVYYGRGGGSYSKLLFVMHPDGFVLHAQNYKGHQAYGGWGNSSHNAQEWDRVRSGLGLSSSNVYTDAMGIERYGLHQRDLTLAGEVPPQASRGVSGLPSQLEDLHHAQQWHPTLPCYLPYQPTRGY